MFTLPVHNQILVFSILLILILLSSVVFKRLRIPGIIILIFFGLVFGPHGIGLIEQNQAIDLFSTIGLLYIMFIVGLDLDLNDFRIHRYKSIIYGILTFAIPMLVGFFVSKYALCMSNEGSMLVACVFATHTLISYPIASKMEVVKDMSVAVTVGGTIITDTAALILLALLLGHSSGHAGWEFALRMVLSGTVLFLIIFKLFPWVLKFFFKRFENEKGAHFILVLSIMFMSSFLAQLGGFEPIIGAFLAGLAVNKMIPSTSALMNRIAFIGNTLFIPFFIVNVGLMMDFRSVIGDWWVVLISIVLTIAALFSKWGAAFITQKVFKMSRVQRQLMFGLSGSHAAITIAVILVGVRAGMISEDVLNAAVVLILLTCSVSALLTERASRELALQMNRSFESSDNANEESEAPNKYMPSVENILVTISLEVVFERLIDFALLIRDKKSTRPLLVGTVLLNDEGAENKVRATRESLKKYVKEASAVEIPLNVMTTLDYNMSSGIVRLTKEAMADTIVMGWPRKMGFLDKLLGANAGGVVGNTNKTVFMCRITRQLILNKRIVLIVPPYAEYEAGFAIWFEKVLKLSRELTLPILLLSNEQTFNAIKKAYSRRMPKFTYNNYEKWDSFLTLKRVINETDLVIVVSARPGSASYMEELEQVPIELEIRFVKNDKVVIYPQHGAQNKIQGLDAVPTLQLRNIGRGLSGMFKNDSQNQEAAE
ncbi:MAG: cation:proton antiporter [Paludibacteraceae bacterium]|nr:cation:proton antiporter [Paludibacteraceae bacterium]